MYAIFLVDKDMALHATWSIDASCCKSVSQLLLPSLRHVDCQLVYGGTFVVQIHSSGIMLVAIDVNIVRITVQITAQPWAPRTH